MAEGGALPYKQVVHVLQTALSNTAGVSVKAEDRFLTLVIDGVPEVERFGIAHPMPYRSVPVNPASIQTDPLPVFPDSMDAVNVHAGELSRWL